MNTTGWQNAFIGGRTGFNNTQGSQNSFIGWQAGRQNITGNQNTFIGKYAGQSNTTGSLNTYIGSNADGTAGLANATAIGAGATVTQNNSVVLGNGASVGIGTSAPGYDLDVVGDINFSGGLYQGGVLFTGADGATGPSGADGSNGSDGVTGPQGPTGPLVSGSSDQTLRHDGSSWVASSLLDNDGSVIRIGSAGAASSVGNTVLSVKGDISGTGFSYLTSFDGTSTQSTGSGVNILNTLTGNMTGATHTGIYNQVNGSAGTHKGVYHFINGTTSSSQYGVHANLSNGTGNAYGVYSDAGSTGSNYAAYLKAENGTSNYALYAAMGDSYFADNVGIGTTDPEAALNVQGGKVLIGTANGTLADLTINTDGTQEIFRGRVGGITNFIIDETGNVGMGVATPNERLEVNGNARFQDSVYVEKMLGVGTTSPDNVLDVQGDVTSTAHVSEFTTNYSGNTDIRAISAISTPADGYGYGVHATGGYRGVYGNNPGGDYAGSSVGVYGYSSGTAGIRYGVYGNASNSGGTNAYGVYGVATGATNNWAGYFGSGNVYVANELLVNTTSGATGYDVSVDGKIICEELKVQASGSWPDYVFAADYTLPTLKEVEDHIEKNNHLPGVPSAAVVEAEGINVGEMQKILMEKVEQLTLYMIDANKKIIDSDQRIKELEETIDALKVTK
ncbi:MAG: hypothetical protein ACI9UR_001084 [Bacteroidia bacterium]